MPFVEMKPGKAGAEFVRVGLHRGGHVMVTISGVVAKRAKLIGAKGYRVLADLESPVRKLRIVADDGGPYKGRELKGGGLTFIVGRLSGLSHIKFDKAEVEWDEDVDGAKRSYVEVELPAALQSKPAAPASTPVTVPRQPARVWPEKARV